MTKEELIEMTHDGNCDLCYYGTMGECHLQCTHTKTDKEACDENN